jgi:hypothetical protein
MFDVATAAVLLPILEAAMKARALSNASAQVIVASEARIGVKSSPGGVALAAVGVAIDLRVRAAELPWR